MATLVLNAAVAAADITNPWAAAAAYAAAAYFGNRIDAQIFAPIVNGGDRHVTGVDYGTPIPYIWGHWRCTAMVIWADSRGLRKYTSNPLKLKGSFATVYGICPRIQPGDVSGAIVHDVWMATSGGVMKHHYDAARVTTDDPPYAFLDGTQQAQDSLISADPALAEGVPAYIGCIGTVWYLFHMFNFGNQVPSIHSALVHANGIFATTLSAILTDCMDLMGVAASRYDFSAVSAVEVIGASFMPGTNMGDFLQGLCEACNCDIFESNGIIKVRPRNDVTPDWIIEYDDLGIARTEDEPRVRIAENIQCPQDLPVACTVAFRNSGKDHEPGEVTATLDTGLGNSTETVDFEFIAMTEAQAESLGYRHLDEIYLRQRSFTFTLGAKYYGMEPADVCDLPLDSDSNRIERVRIYEIQDRDPLGFFTVVAHRVGSAAVSTGGGSDGGGEGGGSGSSGQIAACRLIAFSPGGTNPEPFPADPLAAHPSILVKATWPSGFNENGAEVWVRKSGAADRIYAGLIANRGVIGTAAAAMPDAVSALDFETRSTAIVLYDAGELASTAESVVQSGWSANADGSNYALLGNELLGFAAASPTSSLHYDISDIYGGLRSSVFTGHTDTDRFIDWTQGDLVRYPVPDSDVGATYEVWVLAPGDTFGAATDVIVNAVTSPWLGPPVDGDRVDTEEAGWNAAGDTQFVEFIAHFAAADNLAQLSGLLEWETSVDGCSTWTAAGKGSSLLQSLTSGTLTARCRSNGSNGTNGAWIASAVHAFRANPTPQFVFSEVPTGLVNGINSLYVLAHTPTAGTLQVFLNGVLQNASSQYAASGANVSFFYPPETGDWLVVNYQW